MSLVFSKNAVCSVIRPSATAAATLARHGAYKKFPKKLLAREATRNAKRNARRKKVFAAFEVELDRNFLAPQVHGFNRGLGAEAV